MDIELIYHPFEDQTTDCSPFEEHIARIVEDTYVEIACPYLSLDVLSKITDAADSWRLVTDAEEWSRTQPTATREPLIEFVQRNRERIHDCRKLHAKVVVTEDHALVGSANLTHTGLGRRQEVGVLFHQTDHMVELQDWFGELWARTKYVDNKELQKHVNQLEQEEGSTKTSSMSDVGPLISTPLTNLARGPTPVNGTDHNELVKRVKKSPDRAWIRDYFGWVAELFDTIGLTNDDPSLALTLPTTSPHRIPVIINKRYVLTAFPRKESVGVMLPSDSAAIKTHSEYISEFGAFSTHSDDDPYWFEFPGMLTEFMTDELKRDWIRAAEMELERAVRSQHRSKHSSVVYDAATDTVYRERILDEAFG